jgi:thymidylate kinase
MINKPFSISLIGVDGAGKTTILNIIKKELSKNESKVIELRSRPSILPILSSFIYGKAEAEKKATQNLPRKGKNNSKLSSYVRFSYYLIDYIFGQVYIYFRYSIHGYVVVYDRFYYDYIVDPKRANLIISSEVALFFLKFIKEPNLNVFLYAPPNIIRDRKKELESDSIKLLTKEYLNLFDSLTIKNQKNIKYLAIKNIELEVTVKDIMAEIMKLYD